MWTSIITKVSEKAVREKIKSFSYTYSVRQTQKKLGIHHKTNKLCSPRRDNKEKKQKNSKQGWKSWQKKEIMEKKKHLDIWRSKRWEVPPHFHFPILHLQLGLWSRRATESLSLPQEYLQCAAYRSLKTPKVLKWKIFFTKTLLGF